MCHLDFSSGKDEEVGGIEVNMGDEWDSDWVELGQLGTGYLRWYFSIQRLLSRLLSASHRGRQKSHGPEKRSEGRKQMIFLPGQKAWFYQH